MNKLILAVTFIAATSFAQADDLVVTASNSAKSGSVSSFDLISSGAAAGVQVNIPVTGGKVDLSGLSKSMPGNFSLQSNYDGKEVVLLIANDDNSLMSKGQVSLGTIRVTGGSLGAAKLIAADAKGESISGTVHSN